MGNYGLDQNGPLRRVEVSPLVDRDAPTTDVYETHVAQLGDEWTLWIQGWRPPGAQAVFYALETDYGREATRGTLAGHKQLYSSFGDPVYFDPESAATLRSAAEAIRDDDYRGLLLDARG